MGSDVTNRPLTDLLLFRERAKPEPSGIGNDGLSDEAILLRLESHDRTAAALLFDRYADLVFGIGLRILRNRADAEDFVQDFFVGLVDKVRGFDPGKGSARTWIVQIAYRRAFDRRAQVGRRNFYTGTELDFATNSLQDTALDHWPPDVWAVEQTRAALESLNERQRSTLELYFFEGMTLREISSRLGETFENTRHFYYRGLDRLRRILTQKMLK